MVMGLKKYGNIIWEYGNIIWEYNMGFLMVFLILRQIKGKFGGISWNFRILTYLYLMGFNGIYLFMGKLTISMAIFNSYFKLPGGKLRKLVVFI